MFMGPRNWFQGMNSTSLCSLAGRYDNPIPPRFLAAIDFLKIPAQNHFAMAESTPNEAFRTLSKRVLCRMATRSVLKRRKESVIRLLVSQQRVFILQIVRPKKIIRTSLTLSVIGLIDVIRQDNKISCLCTFIDSSFLPHSWPLIPNPIRSEKIRCFKNPAA